LPAALPKLPLSTLVLAPFVPLMVGMKAFRFGLGLGREFSEGLHRGTMRNRHVDVGLQQRTVTFDEGQPRRTAP
jgi:hypothetical protein